MVSEPPTNLHRPEWLPRQKVVGLGKTADLSTEEKRKQSVAAVWRGFYQRWEEPAAETIQRWWRGYTARRYARALRHGHLIKSGSREWVESTAAVVIQRFWRGWLGRQEAAQIRKAVVDIQRWWKGYRARKEWTRLRLLWRARNYYATDIQKWVRGHLARLRVRRMRQEQQQQQLGPNGRQAHGSVGPGAAAVGAAGHLADPRQVAAATVIQAHWRGHQARKRRAWLRREAAKRRRYEQRLAAAKVIQSYYRGWFVRRAVARLRARQQDGQPLLPGSLAGGVVAAPGVAGDVRNAVVLPYGEYDDDGGDAAAADARTRVYDLPAPHGHPRPPPLPRAAAAPLAPRGRVVGGGGGVRGTVQRSLQDPVARGAPTGPVKAPGARSAAVYTAAIVRQTSQLRSSPPPPPPLPSKPPPALASPPLSASPSALAQPVVRVARGAPTAAGSGLSSIRAVRAAHSGGPGTTSERAKQPALAPGPLAQSQPHPHPQPKQQLKSVGQLGELRVRKDAPSSPTDASPTSPTPAPGPLRSPPPHGGGGGTAAAAAGNVSRTYLSGQTPPAPVTPPRNGTSAAAAAAAAARGGSTSRPHPGPGPSGATGTKPATAPTPLGRGTISSSVAGASSRNLSGAGLGLRPPSADEGGDGADGGGDVIGTPSPALGRTASGAASSPSCRMLAAPRTPGGLTANHPTVHRHDPLRASAPEPLRVSVSVGGGGGSAVDSAAAAPRRRAWESESSIAAGAVSAAAAAAAEAGPQTPRRRASAAAMSAVAAADAASNPLHDQVMRANRGGRVVNAIVPSTASSTAVAAQRRKAVR